ncbi:MAG TPA: bifunctional alpha/beta hydrolase/OsmC family protein [Xanthobacteraceae bacterium]|jgi:putative redox protein
MPSERFEFSNAAGERLAALLDRPIGQPRAYALFAHCFTCGKDVHAAKRIAEALTALGIAVLRFDFTGLGSSEGEFANTTFSSNVADVVAAAAALRARWRAPGILIGHSLGGTAVLAAAADLEEVRAVATIGAPADPAHVVGLFKDSAAETGTAHDIDVTLAGRSFRISRSFLDDVKQQRLGERIATLRKALLVFHSPTDAIVGIENASFIFTAAKHPKSFVSLAGADHLLSKRSDASYVANVIHAWAERYLEAPEVASEMPNDADIVVRETRMGRFQQEITAGRHRLVADEPVEVGGLDSGPNPYGLLLAGLGACTSMTLRLYAERKGLPLERVTVRLKHSRIHAGDCESCETQEGMLDRIDRAITLTGDLKPEERKRLLEIADRCPVHRTLTSEIDIRTVEQAQDG